MMTIPMLLLAFMTPLFGYITDKIGKRSHLMILATLILASSFVMLVIFPMCQNSGNCDIYYIVPLLVNGLGGSLFTAVIWPCIPLICDKKLLGTAFGILDCS